MEKPVNKQKLHHVIRCHLGVLHPLIGCNEKINSYPYVCSNTSQPQANNEKKNKNILKICINFSVLSKISTMSVYGEQLVIGRKMLRMRRETGIKKRK